MHNFVLGVDAGNTKTRAVVANSAGAILARAESGPANPGSLRLDEAIAQLALAIEGALAEAHASSPVASGCLGVAGIAHPTAHAGIDRWLRSVGYLKRWRVVHDGELVLAAGTPAGWGVALVAGTGSVAFARSVSGDTLQVGGWGSLLGDEGSGYHVAMQAIRLALRTVDGRADAHTLLEAVLEFFGVRSPFEILAVVERAVPSEIAAFAPQVFALEEVGDEHALGVIADAASALRKLLETAVERLECPNPPIALAGGMLDGSERLRRAVVANSVVELGPVSIVDDPVAGAVTLALRDLDLERGRSR